MDDDRELRIPSGSIIGIIMLLLALLPRDIGRDLIARMHQMNNEYSPEVEQNQEISAAERATTASEGEVLSSVVEPERLASDEEEDFSALFD